MCPWKCLEPVSTLRGPSGLAALFLVAAFLSGVCQMEAIAAQAVILPPDAAARAFSQGRDALKKGDADAAIRLLGEALATGHDRPAARLGTNRYFVERYDPYYWLGVAWMQKGDRDRAREALQKSASYGLIQQWPEGADLNRRLSELTAQAAPPPTPTATAPPPTTAPTPVPTLPVEPPARTPGVAPPIPTEPARSASPTPTSFLPVRPAAPLPEMSSELREELVLILRAAEKADWTLASSRARAARSRYPDHPQPALVEAVVLGSRFLLEGGKDEKLRRGAREALLDFRRLGGTAKQEATWLSPALGAALSY